MTSAPTTFKLSKRDGPTRRISFQQWPDWGTLAFKIASLYEIPVDKVGVSYIDADGDEVTLSSQEELEDFRQTGFQPGKLAKLAVQDFRHQLHDDKTSSSPRTLSPNDRNTFGPRNLPFVVGIEEDWQPLPIPNIFLSDNPIMSGTTTPHAYVETVDDEEPPVPPKNNSTLGLDAVSTTGSSRFSTVRSTISKGKSRAEPEPELRPTSVALSSSSDGISSTVSALAEDTPSKPPVHVYDRGNHPSNRSAFQVPSSSSRAATSRGDVTPAQAESTPKAPTVSLDTEQGLVPSHQEHDAPDPPLPTIDAPSLSNDVASLLNTLTTVFSSHPELSESLRQIIQNSSNGTYWATHRETITNAAQELVRSAEATGRAAEEEAGRRVAEAIGTIVKSIADVTGTTTNTSDVTPAPRPPAPPAGPHPPPHLPPWARHNRWSSGSWRGDYGGGPFGYAYPRPRWPPGPGMYPPPPPPPPVHDLPPPPMHPPPVPPPPPPPFPPSWSHDMTPWNDSHDAAKMKREESRAQVEAAKMYYKTEKERYRQEREERRKEKERIAALRHKVTASPEHQSEAKASTPTVVQESPAPAPPPEPRPKTPVITLPVSQAHGRYPEFEMYSVPKRHNTHLGHAHQTRRPSTGETHARSLSRITKRLADMGFTENAYPSLPSKIRANLNPERLVHKDSEDDIVTTLLEEMLATSPKSPKPSGSRGPPGAWD